MKKIKASALLSIICLPMLLIFTTVDESVSWFNLIGLAYTVVIAKYYKRIFPRFLVEFVESFKE